MGLSLAMRDLIWRDLYSLIPTFLSSFISYQALTGPLALVHLVFFLSSKLSLPNCCQISAWAPLYGPQHSIFLELVRKPFQAILAYTTLFPQRIFGAQLLLPYSYLSMCKHQNQEP